MGFTDDHTEPGLYTDPEDIPKELSHPRTTPTTGYAAGVAAKEGDLKTTLQMMGARQDKAQGNPPARRSTYRAIYNQRKKDVQ